MSRPVLSRRAALFAPLALSGCGLMDDWFSQKKTPLPGERESIFTVGSHGLIVDDNVPKVVLPAPVRNAGWPQAGGNPAHNMGHLAGRDELAEAWSADIGAGGGYRRVILAQPVVASGKVFTMDSSAKVTAFTLDSGKRLWRVDTVPDDVDSTNVGGGLGIDGTTLYASNGVSQLVALDTETGEQKWRRDIALPARSAPTIADGRVFLTNIEDRLLAFSAEDGHPLWDHQAAEPVTALLGRPAPAYFRGLVVAGFGSGELAAMRADSGTVAWTDGLSAGRGRTSIADFVSIRGAPVISNGQVFAISMGGLLVATDVPSGRRLWERQVAGANTPYVAGDWLFVVSADQEIAAVHTPTGRVAWVTALPRYDDPAKKKQPLTWYGPLLVEDRLIVTGTSEEALAISPYSGRILGKIDLSSSAAPLSPVVADGTVLIVTNSGNLLALR